MKDKYIDQYGLDSLPNLRLASENRIPFFVTINKDLVNDRRELEKLFNIKIRTPEEMNKLLGEEKLKVEVKQ